MSASAKKIKPNRQAAASAPERRWASRGVVFRQGVQGKLTRLPAQQGRALTYHRDNKTLSPFEQQALACSICRRAVCLALGVALVDMQSASRNCADIAVARQIAMYFAHTMFGFSYHDVGEQFSRDRTTVAYACRKVEDLRESSAFDATLCEIESMLAAMVDMLEAKLHREGIAQ